MPKYVHFQMPRYPGTPAPSWPGTFFFALACLPGLPAVHRLWNFFSGQPSSAAATDKVHLTSPRRSTQEIRRSDHPTDRPQGLYVRVAQIIHEQAGQAGRGKDRQSRFFSLHCTVAQTNQSIYQSIYQLALQRSIQSAIHPCFFCSPARSLAHPIRHWQSHPYLAPGNGNGAGTKRHQWPSDLGQQKSLVLISAPGGRPFVFLELAHDGAAGKSAGQATRARPGPSANSITSSLASRLGAEPS